jgi:hypothetical protein
MWIGSFIRYLYFKKLKDITENETLENGVLKIE